MEEPTTEEMKEFERMYLILKETIKMNNLVNQLFPSVFLKLLVDFFLVNNMKYENFIEFLDVGKTQYKQLFEQWKIRHEDK